MATREALAIRREAAFARIAAAAGVEPPAANRDPDVTLTQLVEWAAEVICGPEPDPEPDTAEANTEKTAPARKSKKATE